MRTDDLLIDFMPIVFSYLSTEVATFDHSLIIDGALLINFTYLSKSLKVYEKLASAGNSKF